MDGELETTCDSALHLGSGSRERAPIPAADSTGARYRTLVSSLPDMVLHVTPTCEILEVKPALNGVTLRVSPPRIGSSLSDWPPCAAWAADARAHIAAVARERIARRFRGSLNDVDTTERGYVEVLVVGVADDEILVVVHDLSEQHRLEQQLLQSQKLEAIGQLAAGIAHEINTPLQYVSDNVRFIQEAIGSLLAMVKAYESAVETAGRRTLSGPDIAALNALADDGDLPYMVEHGPGALEAALEGLGRVARIVAAMKAFAHPGRVEKAYFDLNQAVETTLTISANTWKRFADIRLDLDPKLVPALCHGGELNQVILNLVVNASDAIAEAITEGGKKGLITIATKNLDGAVELSIADNGSGIPEAVRSRIFEPFFTTKEVGRGSGQGLPIVRNIVVEKHGGTIDFETEVGKGTRFILRMPTGNAPPTETIG